MAKYRLSKKAQNDIEGIWEYTAQTWSITQAQKYDLLLQKRIEEISNDPSIGKPYEYVRSGYFRISVKSHLIFYRLVNNTVEITRVLHQRMDIDRHL